jgi:hypothetical protein
MGKHDIVVELEHVVLGKIEDGHTKDRGPVHGDCGKMFFESEDGIVFNDSVLFDEGRGDDFEGAVHMLRSHSEFHISPPANLFHGLAKDSIVHKLREIFGYGISQFSLFGVDVNIGL